MRRQDAVYIDLGGSHAHKGEGTAPNDLVTSLMETRHPLDAKMKQSQVALFKVISIDCDITAAFLLHCAILKVVFMLKMEERCSY